MPILYNNKNKRLRVNSRPCVDLILQTSCITRSHSGGKILLNFLNINNLDKDKIFAYLPDKTTLVFQDAAQAARQLTPKRVQHLSDVELNINKYIQHILRVIYKGVLTETEIGNFFY